MLTVSDLLQNALARYGNTIALRVGGRSISYRELDERSSSLAAFLAERGVERGDRVALHLRNCFEYVVSDLAILKLAAVKVPLNELMAPAELEYCLTHAEVRVVISHSSLPEPDDWPAPVLRISVPDQSPGKLGWVSWDEAVTSNALREDRVVAKADDTALIAYTGGTTGRPKGVQHSQHRLALNLLEHVICGDIRSGEIMLLTTPLPHSAGYHLQACLLQGGTVVIAPKFDAASFTELVSGNQVSWTFAVPTMLYRLFDVLMHDDRRLSSLRTIVYGAAPMSEARLSEGLEKLGPVFIQLYGQTECPNYVTSLSKAEHLLPHLLKSCGRPVALAQVRITNPDGELVTANQAGEVEVLSPYLLIQYYKDPEVTAEQIRDGWLRTGDVGYLDEEGYLFLIDRSKDMIISGGMNVYSGEVEAALRKHPGVRDIAVVGKPDPDWGEAVVAFVVADGEPSEGDLRAYAKRFLSGYKAPKHFKFIEALPLTTYGKIDKKALRSLFLESG